MDKVSDLAWSANEQDPWFLATVSEDNVLHVWQPSENLIFEEGSDDDASESNSDAEEATVEESTTIAAGQSKGRDESADADAEKDRKLKKMRPAEEISDADLE